MTEKLDENWQPLSAITARVLQKIKPPAPSKEPQRRLIEQPERVSA